MAGKLKKGKSTDKWRKKKYFPVLAPKVFHERELCQTIAYDTSNLEGRSLKINLMMLTGNMRAQHTSVTFKINKVQGNTCYTMVEKCELLPVAIKRKVRRQRDRLDDVLTAVTKDNKKVRVKALIITAVKTSRSVKIDLKKAVAKALRSQIRALDYSSLVLDVVHDKFQKSITRAVCKIIPMKSVNIRYLKYLGEIQNIAKSTEDTSKTEAVKTETVKTEAVKTETVKTEAVKTESKAVEA